MRRALIPLLLSLPVLAAPFDLRADEGKADPAAEFRIADPKAVADVTADYVIVTPPAFAEACLPLARHRAACGHTVRIALTTDIYKAYSEDGSADPQAIKLFLRALYGNGKEPRLAAAALIGDAFPEGENTIGRFLKKQAKGSMVFDPGEIGSDNSYGCMDKDAIPDIAVGRVPAKDAETLTRYIERVVRYETDPAPGTWRRRVQLISGSGRFGPEIDKMLEDLFTDIVSNHLPPTYDVGCLYANPNSPYCYAPEEFNDKALELINNGALMTAYIGHGSFFSFDRLTFRGENYTILNEAQCRKVKVGKAPPLFVIIACSTGDYDDKVDCLAEGLVLSKDGPVAVIASSRVSEPYANGLLAKCLLETALRDRCATAGQAFRQAKERLMAEEPEDALRKKIDALAGMFMGGAKGLSGLRKNQMYLYNYFGDPGLRLRHIAGQVALTAPATVKPGESLKVQGKAEGITAGQARITLEVERKNYVVQPEPNPEESEEFSATAKANFDKANNKVVESIEKTMTDGTFECAFEIPKTLPPGKYWIKVYCAAPQVMGGSTNPQPKAAEAVGAASVEVQESGGAAENAH